MLYDSIDLAMLPSLAGANHEYCVVLRYKGRHLMGIKDGAQWGIIGHELATVSFSSCQQNLIKTFQIEGMIILIT